MTNSSSWLASEVISMNCERLPIVAAAMRSTSWSSLPANEEIEKNCFDLLPAVIKMQSRYLLNSTGTRQTMKWNSALGADGARPQNATHSRRCGAP